jgi:hypothetical protein
MDTLPIANQFAAAYAMSSLLEWLKTKTWFPFVNVNTSTLNRITAILAALISAAGIHWAYDAAVGQLVISGLKSELIYNSLSAAFIQYAFQQFLYKTTVKAK